MSLVHSPKHMTIDCGCAFCLLLFVSFRFICTISFLFYFNRCSADFRYVCHFFFFFISFSESPVCRIATCAAAIVFFFFSHIFFISICFSSCALLLLLLLVVFYSFGFAQCRIYRTWWLLVFIVYSFCLYLSPSCPRSVCRFWLASFLAGIFVWSFTFQQNGLLLFGILYGLINTTLHIEAAQRVSRMATDRRPKRMKQFRITYIYWRFHEIKLANIVNGDRKVRTTASI